MAAKMTCRLAAALALASVPAWAELPEIDETCALGEQCDDAALLQISRRAGPIGLDIEYGTESTLLQEGEEPKCDGKMSIYPYIQPKLWGTAYSGWETCAGEAQSPINIIEKWCHKGAKDKGPLKQHYGLPDALKTDLSNTGHNLGVDGNFGTLQVEDINFQTAGFHFHTPSETMVNGRHASLEMHIVNTEVEEPLLVSTNGTAAHSSSPSGGRIAVVGILFDIGKENKCLKEIFEAPAPQAGCAKLIGQLDLGTCFEKQLGGPWWSFMGSLTTPPCTEGLYWNVMKVRSTISWQQLQVFKTRYVMNARPSQPLNGRKVTYNKGR